MKYRKLMIARLWTFGLILLGFTSVSARADQELLNSSLRHAARLGLLGDIKKLISEGAEVDAPASYGETALQYAALYGHTSTVRELIRAGADVNHRDFDDNTPLVAAAQNCNSRTLAFLLAHGADPNRENHQGRTALTLATSQSCARAVRVLLDTPGIDPLHRDDWDHTALDYAREDATTFGDYSPETLIRLRKAEARSSRVKTHATDPDPVSVCNPLLKARSAID